MSSQKPYSSARKNTGAKVKQDNLKGTRKTAPIITKQRDKKASSPVVLEEGSKSKDKKNALSQQFNLPPYVKDGSCIPPGDGEPHYYKLREDKAVTKTQQALSNESLANAPGTDKRQLAASYWNLLLGPTQFIYWDPNAKNITNTDPTCRGKDGRWILIDKARDILEGQSPPTQCNNVIGNNDYLSTQEYSSWYNTVFKTKNNLNFAKLYDFFNNGGGGFIKFRKTCCWICGFPLYPNNVVVGDKKSTNPPCEHILPVVNAIFNLKLYQRPDKSFTTIHQRLFNEDSNHNPFESFTETEIDAINRSLPNNKKITVSDKQNYIDHIPELNQLLKEYAWSHTCCNSIKDDYNLITARITKTKSELIPNQTKIEGLLDEIWEQGCFQENISFLNKVYNKTGSILTIPNQNKKKWIAARRQNMMDVFLQPICDYANITYSEAPLLYSLASIANIVNSVPIELRNLLLFSTISEDKLQDGNGIKWFINLTDNELNDITDFKPDFEENSNVVYSVANKIATIIQSNCITGSVSSRNSSAKQSAPAENYISFLNDLFSPIERQFTNEIIKDVMSYQEKKYIPDYNQIIGIYIYKTINAQIYDFYKLMFMYLKTRLNIINESTRAELSTSTYNILLYQFLLDNLETKVNLTINTPPAIQNLYQNIIGICNTFIKNEENNVMSLLEKYPEVKNGFWTCLKYLWPTNVTKPQTFKDITERIDISEAEKDNFSQEEKNLKLSIFASLPSSGKRKKRKGNIESSEEVTSLARQLSTRQNNNFFAPVPAPISAPVPAPDSETPIKEIKDETTEFKRKLNILIEVLEIYNESLDDDTSKMEVVNDNSQINSQNNIKNYYDVLGSSEGDKSEEDDNMDVVEDGIKGGRVLKFSKHVRGLTKPQITKKKSQFYYQNTHKRRKTRKKNKKIHTFKKRRMLKKRHTLKKR